MNGCHRPPDRDFSCRESFNDADREEVRKGLKAAVRCGCIRSERTNVSSGLEAACCNAAYSVSYDAPKADICATPKLPWQQLVRAKLGRSAFGSGLWIIQRRTTASSPFQTLDLRAASDANCGLRGFAARAKTLGQFPKTGHSPRNGADQPANDGSAGHCRPSREVAHLVFAAYLRPSAW